MTDEKAAAAMPNRLDGLPIRPTGSGVADLEVAYEQMKLAEAADQAEPLNEPGAAHEIGPVKRP